MSRLPRLLAFSSLCSLAYGLCDLAFSWNPLAAAPYLAHAHEPAFRAAPLLELGLLAECVNGLMAAAAYLLVQRALPAPTWKRGASYGATIWCFWVVSGTFTAAVWLAVPASVALSNVAFGLGKCLAIGMAVATSARLLGLTPAASADARSGSGAP